MSEEKRKILEMVESGAISAEDGRRLLEALGDEEDEEGPSMQNEPENSGRDYDPQAGPHAITEDGDSLGSNSGVENPAVKVDLDLAFQDSIDEINNEVNGVKDIIQGAFSGLRSFPLGDDENKGEPVWKNGERFPAQRIYAMRVLWSLGPVNISGYDGEEIVLEECSSKELDDTLKMVVDFSGGNLKVSYCRSDIMSGRRWVGGLPQKSLNVLLPRDTALNLDSVLLDSGAGRLAVRELSGYELVLKTGSGEISAESLGGTKLSFTTGSGGITVKDLNGADFINLRTGSGKVSALSLAGEGEIKIVTGSGGVEVREAKAGAGFRITVGSGFASAYSVQSPSCEISGGSGPVRLNFQQIPETVRVKAGSGNVEIGLPQDERGFSVNFQTGSGSFTSDLPVSGKFTDGDGSFESVAGTDGARARIEIRTGSGSLRLVRAEK